MNISIFSCYHCISINNIATIYIKFCTYLGRLEKKCKGSQWKYVHVNFFGPMCNCVSADVTCMSFCYFCIFFSPCQNLFWFFDLPAFWRNIVVLNKFLSFLNRRWRKRPIFVADISLNKENNDVIVAVFGESLGQLSVC